MIESSDPLRSWIPMSDLSFGRWKKGRPSCGNIVPAISQGRMQGPYYVYSSKVSQKRWISMVQWLTTGSFTQKPTSHKAVVFVFPPWIRGKAPTHATTNVSWSNTNIHHIWNLHGKHVKLLPTIHIFTYGQGLSGFCLQAFISFASRHLDLGLCRTFWIGWIHPVNFQSWPLEESIFPLSNYVIYDVIYIYILCLFSSFNHLESSIYGHCQGCISSAKTPQMAYNGTPSQTCHKHSYYSWQLLSQLPGYWVYNGLKHSTPVLGYQCRSIKGVAILEPNILPKFPYH